MRYKEIQKPIQLDEITMSPSNLRAEAKKIGAIAGMEFEMIVPDISEPSDESEPDYDQDERIDSFRDIENFFNVGDMNGARQVERFVDSLRDEFSEWSSEQVSDRFYSREGREYFEEYAEDEFDEDDARTSATEEITEANPDLEEDSEEFADLVDNRIKEMKKEWLEDQWDSQSRLFEEARERFEESAYDDIDESEWLRDNSYLYMSDLPYTQNDIYWPHFTEPDSETDATQVAASFEDAVGRPVNVSSSYHGRRVEGEYTVEPDGSLSPDDSDDAGLEFVSPPLPLDQMLSDLNATVAWAKEYGCYTNDSTGLHMNVSVPNYSRQNLDFVKLALLLGDEYILDQFGRLSNNYAKSALGKVKSVIQQNPEKAATALETMKSALAGEAARVIHSGSTDKYTSINTKTGYIEFRSPGGDWLNADIGKLENTLLRFVVALDAACDPEKYKQEYLKKFYKLLEPSMDEYGVMVKNFSDYVTGVGGAPETVVKDFRRAALASLQKSNAMRKEKDADKFAHPEPKIWHILNAAGNKVGTVTARYQVGAEELARRQLLAAYPGVNTAEFTVRAAPVGVAAPVANTVN